MIRLLPLLLLVGCTTLPKTQMPPGLTDSISQTVASETNNACSPMLGLLGGFCLLGGMVLLVISRGTLGWRPLVGGVVFILINYALAMYAHWFFIPVAISTGVISLAWAVKITLRILRNQQLKEIKL